MWTRGPLTLYPRQSDWFWKNICLPIGLNHTRFEVTSLRTNWPYLSMLVRAGPRRILQTFATAKKGLNIHSEGIQWTQQGLRDRSSKRSFDKDTSRQIPSLRFQGSFLFYQVVFPQALTAPSQRFPPMQSWTTPWAVKVDWPPVL